MSAPQTLFDALRRARYLLAGGEEVAEPVWFDQADDLVSQIDVLLAGDVSDPSSDRRKDGAALSSAHELIGAMRTALIAAQTITDAAVYPRTAGLIDIALHYEERGMIEGTEPRRKRTSGTPLADAAERVQGAPEQPRKLTSADPPGDGALWVCPDRGCGFAATHHPYDVRAEAGERECPACGLPLVEYRRAE